MVCVLRYLTRNLKVSAAQQRKHSVTERRSATVGSGRSLWKVKFIPWRKKKEMKKNNKKKTERGG